MALFDHDLHLLHGFLLLKGLMLMVARHELDVLLVFLPALPVTFGFVLQLFDLGLQLKILS